MAARIELSSAARRFLERAEPAVRKRLVERISRLAVEPVPRDSKRIKGRAERLFRIRVGDLRVLYALLEGKECVLVVDIGKRESVYDR